MIFLQLTLKTGLSIGYFEGTRGYVIYSPRRGAPIYTFVDHDQIFEQQVLFNREPTNIFKDWCNMITFFPISYNSARKILDGL